MKVVIGTNVRVAHDFLLEWAERSGIKLVWFTEYDEDLNAYDYWRVDFYGEEVDDCNYFSFGGDVSRTDPVLIQMVEEGYPDIESNRLHVVEIPDDIEWNIGEHEDGQEYIAEAHRTWY